MALKPSIHLVLCIEILTQSKIYQYTSKRIKIILYHLILYFLYLFVQIFNSKIKRNIFLTRDDRIKLGDFGYAYSNNTSGKVIMTEIVGTLPYMSPEVKNKHYTTTTDIWFDFI